MKSILENRPLMLGIIFVVLSIGSVIAGNVIFKENSEGGITLTVDEVETNNGLIDFNGNDLNNTGNICDEDDCYNPDFELNATQDSDTLVIYI